MKSEEGGRIRRRNSEEEEETKEEDKEESKSAPSGQALRYSAFKALGTIDRGGGGLGTRCTRLVSNPRALWGGHVKRVA